MDYPEITKTGMYECKIKPNLNIEDFSDNIFDWAQIENELGIDNLEEINLAHLAVDRHARSENRDKIAFYWEGKTGETESYTYAEFSRLTNKFANVLTKLGVTKGDRIFTFIERLPEVYIAVFGSLKIGAIVGPLFADFGPDPVRDRLQDSGAKVLLTSPALRERISSIISDLPDLKHIIIVDREGN